MKAAGPTHRGVYGYFKSKGRTHRPCARRSANEFPPAKGIRLVGVTLSSFERRDSNSSEQRELDLGTP
jgi:hypothetical protein